MQPADLELSLRPAGDAYAATARLTPPERQATATLAEDVPVRLDRAMLLEAALDPDEYGRRLTAMLFADQRLQDAWREARGFAHGAQSTLRLRLDPADDLHNLYWETIRDPISDTPLARNQQVLLSRYLNSPDLTPIAIPERADLSALVVIAAPTDLDQYGLASIDVAGESARVAVALSDIPTTTLASTENGQRATLVQLAAALHAGHSILYIVAHGSFVDGRPYLWLEQDDGVSHRVAGTELAQLIAGLSRRPLLIVLAACDGAGQSHSNQALAAIGPLLARVGIGAVIAMQGAVRMALVERLMPPLFRELRHDGQIDHALAAARSALHDAPDWWRPALFMRVADGRLFTPPKPVVARPPGPPAWWERFRHHPLIFFPTVAVVVLATLLTLAVGGIDAINGFPQAQEHLREWGLIDAIPREEPGEILLVVVPFYHSENIANTEPHIKIQRAIEQTATELGLPTLRVAVASQTLRADDRDGAEELAKRSDASIIVWGENTGDELIISFLNVKLPAFSTREVTIIEHERTLIANPSAYARFNTVGLPRQMTFLSLFAVGQSFYMDGQFDRALATINQATEIVPLDNSIDGLANAFFWQGWFQQVTGGNLEASLIAYTKVIQLEPSLAIAFTNRGGVYALQQQYDKAIQDYSQAIRLDPASIAAFNNRGSAYIGKQQYDKAIQDYSQAIRLDPNYATAFYNLGVVYEAQGKYNEALRNYTSAISLEPKYSSAFHNRGNVFANLGQYNEAIQDYSSAIEIVGDISNIDSSLFYNSRGNAYAAQKQYELAMQDYNEAINRSPVNAAAFYNRGNVYRDQNQLTNAIRDYTKAIQLEPNYVAAFVNRGNVYFTLGQQEQAIQDYTKAIDLNNNLAIAIMNRGSVYFERQQYGLAIADFSEVIRLQPSNLQAIYSRGNAYTAQKQYGLAIQDYTKAINLSPKGAYIYYSRGNIYAIQEDHDSAIEDYTKAIQIDPARPEFFNNRGVEYESLGQYDLAIQDYTSSIELDSSGLNAAAFFNRARSYIAQNQRDLAIADLTRARDLALDSAVRRAAIEQLQLLGVP